MSEITIVQTVETISIEPDTSPVEVVINSDPVSVNVSDTAIPFPQVVEADSQEAQDAFFAAGAKIVIRTDLV